MKKMNFKRPVKQAGFTLIELIVVIVILGIMAATALPKFVDISSDAHKAKMQAAAGAIKSVAAMEYSKSALTGTATYPTAAVAIAGAGLSTADYTVSGSDVEDASKAGCKITYSDADGSVSAPTGC